jgi:hypothetical protein
MGFDRGVSHIVNPGMSPQGVYCGVSEGSSLWWVPRGFPAGGLPRRCGRGLPHVDHPGLSPRVSKFGDSRSGFQVGSPCSVPEGGSQVVHRLCPPMGYPGWLPRGDPGIYL